MLQTMSEERKKQEKVRLDKALVLRKLVSSRTRATTLIKDRKITLNNSVVSSPDFLISPSDTVLMLGEDIPWVSRAGLKLAHALDYWHIDPKGKVVLDIGASTGGFTEVLLSHGAKKVYALDVGHGQLAEKLRGDPRVVNMEGVHINNVVPTNFAEPIEMIVVDVSFISLEKVLPKIKELLKKDGILIALIKPQFEVGKERIGKGIVSDPKLHASVITRIEHFVTKLGFTVREVISSPILGGDGNKEFLLYAQLAVE